MLVTMFYDCISYNTVLFNITVGLGLPLCNYTPLLPHCVLLLVALSLGCVNELVYCYVILLGCYETVTHCYMATCDFTELQIVITHPRSIACDGALLGM